MITNSSLLRLLVLPAVRFCLRRSLGVYDLLEILKVTFVELAREQLLEERKRVSASRISVMTGVHRRDVRRLVETGKAASGPKNLLTRVLGFWEQSPQFTTKSGRPKVLTCTGEESEFEQLVRAVSSDVKPATVLSELVRVGIAKQEGERVKLVRAVDSYAKATDPSKAFEILSRDMESLVTAVEQNVEGVYEVGNLHTRTEYDRVYPEDIPRIRRWLVKAGNSFHHSVRGYVSKSDEDLNPKEGKKGSARVVTVSFSWTTPPQE